jgi:hypothetical protein
LITEESQGSHKRTTGRETFFAPAGRASQISLRKSIEHVTSNAIADTLLQTVSGLAEIVGH